MFQCGFCGKEYPTIEGRMECERTCNAERLRKQEEAKKVEMRNKRESDLKELENLIKQREGINKKIDEISNRSNLFPFTNSTLFSFPFFGR